MNFMRVTIARNLIINTITFNVNLVGPAQYHFIFKLKFYLFSLRVKNALDIYFLKVENNVKSFII